MPIPKIYCEVLMWFVFISYFVFSALFDNAKDTTPIKHPTINNNSVLVTLSPFTKYYKTLVIKGAVLKIIVTMNKGMVLIL